MDACRNFAFVVLVAAAVLPLQLSSQMAASSCSTAASPMSPACTMKWRTLFFGQKPTFGAPAQHTGARGRGAAGSSVTITCNAGRKSRTMLHDSCIVAPGS
jgi:hypothetical protein